MMPPFQRWRASGTISIHAAPGLLLLLLLAPALAFLAGCTGGEKGARSPAPAPATEVFESFGGDAVIEEEIIAPPPEPVPLVAPPQAPAGYEAPGSGAGLAPAPAVPAAPPGERDRRRPPLPLSSPGAAPPGAAPQQPDEQP